MTPSQTWDYTSGSDTSLASVTARRMRLETLIWLRHDVYKVLAFECSRRLFFVRVFVTIIEYLNLSACRRTTFAQRRSLLGLASKPLP